MSANYNQMDTQSPSPHEPPRAVATLDITFETDALTTLVQLFDRHGDAYRAFSPALARDIWVLSHPDHVRHVLVDHHANFTKGIGIERVAILLGKGLMTSEGDEWRSQRRLVQPSFHRTVIATWMPHIHAANDRLADKWAAAAQSGSTVNVTQDMSEVTLEVVLRALFGDDIDRLAAAPGENPFALLTDHTARNLAFAYKFRQLGKRIMEDIARRRREQARGNDIVSLLIDARDRQTGEPMSDRALLDEILTLIIAGHETTASSLNWFWYLLTQSPEVARRLHVEVDAGPGVAPAYEQLADFPYVRRALDETLRLYPPGWLLTRRSIEASTIGRYALPPRTDVLISPYLIQRHPGYWPQPERFDPDRFLPEVHAARDRFVYLPFGLGPRACIGEHLALIEMHAHVATLARRFALELAAGQTIEMEPQVNLRTRQPLHMHVKVRH
ncbi:MAG: cytochrome P450 [Casimicrobiaceae bacterium]